MTNLRKSDKSEEKWGNRGLLRIKGRPIPLGQKTFMYVENLKIAYLTFLVSNRSSSL